ncbi:MAG: ComEC/Rec2 family competence protein [Verrucomicrobia bacterium]|nr:ComEC/Rec2 family competence protein [Verrucomicrobiota bacterium]
MIPESAAGWRQFPLGRPAICFALGVWLRDVCDIPFGVAWGCAMMGCVALLHPRWADVGLMIALMFAGAARLSLAVTPWDATDLRHLLPASETLVSIEGTLLESPVERASGQAGRTNYSTTARVFVERLRLDGEAWRSAQGEIVVAARGRLDGTFRGGRRIALNGLIHPPPEAAFPGGFDYRAYLSRNGVFFQLRSEAPRDWRLLVPSPLSPLTITDRFQDWGRRTMMIGLPEEDETVRLLWAMVLGWKGGLSSDQSEPFMRSGTIHVFAISGLHIALIAGIFIGVGLISGMPRSVAGLIAMPGVWAYTGLTGWQASAIRSAVMMSVVAAGWAIQRPWNLINSLATAALILLFWDPQQLFQAGFQLSFVVVFSLATLAPVFQGWLQRKLATESLVPHSRPPRWKEWRDGALRALVLDISVAAAAWIGSLPWVVHYFHVFNPVSLVANLVVVPLSTIALSSSVASLACGEWFPGLTELFNHSSWLWMKLMVAASRYAAEFPGGCWNAAAPGWMGFAIYYLALLVFFARALLPPSVRKPAYALLAALAATQCGLGLWEFKSARLTLLPRRTGATLWAQAPGFQANWLIDPGDERTARVQTDPFLAAAGVNRIQRLALSQGVTGAMGGAGFLETRFSVRQRFAPDVPVRSIAWRKWKSDLERHNLSCVDLSQGDHAEPWIVLYPPSTRSALPAEDAPLVLKGWFSGVCVLWLPALSGSGQNALVESELDLSADLLVAGIPSRGIALSEALLERIHPSVGVLVDEGSPAARRNAAGQSKRIFSSAPRWFVLSETGALRIDLEGGRIRVRPSKPRGLPLQRRRLQRIFQKTRSKHPSSCERPVPHRQPSAIHNP